jgi:hypothetical protein
MGRRLLGFVLMAAVFGGVVGFIYDAAGVRTAVVHRLTHDITTSVAHPTPSPAPHR